MRILIEGRTKDEDVTQPLDMVEWPIKLRISKPYTRRINCYRHNIDTISAQSFINIFLAVLNNVNNRQGSNTGC